MSLKLDLFWHQGKYTDQENERWSHLRTIEWGSYPAFISPIFGPLIVLTYGWLTLIILLFILAIIWKLFFIKNPNINILSFFVLPVNILKWPIGVICALIAWNLHKSPLLIASLALFKF